MGPVMFPDPCPYLPVPERDGKQVACVTYDQTARGLERSVRADLVES